MIHVPWLKNDNKALISILLPVIFFSEPATSQPLQSTVQTPSYLIPPAPPRRAAVLLHSTA